MQSQASALPSHPQGQGVICSPHHGSLCPVLKWGVSTAKASRSQGSLVYPCAGCYSTLLQGTLHYVHIMLSSSKMDPFHQGCPIIISCTSTPVCRACMAWHVLQQHQQTQTSPDAPFLQIDSRPLGCVTLVKHIKDIATWLGLDPSRYSGHSLCIRGATSVVQAGLSEWQIKLMGWWNSQVYQVYIKQDPLACADLAAHMAANSWYMCIQATRSPGEGHSW